MNGKYWALASALLVVNGGAVAQKPPANVADYPARPLRIIVPQSPGASTDLTARLVAQRLSEAFNQPVVVDNRPGAGTMIGTEMVVRAAPDGYTLMVVAAGITINPSIYARVPYDTERDLAPITQLTQFSNLLAAHPSFAAKTLQEFLAMAKAKPGGVTYASAGIGSGTHLSMALLESMAGIKLHHVPYKGGGPAVVATIAGEVPLNIGTTAGVLPHVRSGKLRALAVTTAKRQAAALEVPTMAEAGVPGYDHGPWNGMFAPAKTSRAIIDKVQAEVARALFSQELRKTLADNGLEPIASTPDAFAKLIRSELALWPKVVKAAGIKPE